MEVIQIILTSLTAGIILNFMPCVLPILGIKLQSLTGISHKKEVKEMCIFTSLGIMFFMMLTAGIFQTFNFFFWGFQLQNPFFISFLLFVMVFLAFILIGKINFNPNIQHTFKSKNIESFAYGFLIVVFSVSCTAPVIGSAIVFASLSNINLWVVMFFIGLGLSAPYLLFILFPNIVLKINMAKHISGFIKWLSFALILLTIVFLIYVLYTTSNLLIVVISIILMLASVLIYTKYKKFLILILAQILIFGVIFIGIEKAEKTLKELPVTIVPFSEDRLNNFIAKGHTVVVNFDASWCINCKGNNMLAFNTEEFKKYTMQNNIIFMQADVTIKNVSLENFMARFGVYAVPFTAVFSSKHPEGKLMPAFLTTQILIKEIQYYGF